MTDAIHPTTVPDHSGSYSELDSLCKLIREQKVILWVGSGFSSYAGYPTGSELSSIILSATGKLPSDDPDPSSVSLKKIADYYAALKGRDSLINLLKEHYGKIPDRCEAHKSLALINRVKYIITTNYDPLFEYSYGNKIVTIAHDEELPGTTDYPEKTILLKIHGDLSDPDSIIITSDDYEKFDKDSIVWNKIKSLLAEYSVVFIGYSVSDSNVKEMLTDIDKRLKGRKHPYFFIEHKSDEDKRKTISEYDLRLIKMDALAAVDHITENAIQYAHIDCMKDLTLLTKSDQIFADQGFHVDYSISQSKISPISFVSDDPTVHPKFSLTLTPKGESKKIHEFHDLIVGKKCDPVTIAAADCDIGIHDVVMNKVFIIDPSKTSLNEIVITPNPVKEHIVDLQIRSRQIRLNDLKMKVYGSPESIKLVIDDPDFNLTIRPSGSKGGRINFTTKYIIFDIDRACTIFGLFSALIEGEAIEFISPTMLETASIKSSTLKESLADSDMIISLYQMYRDLHEIQNRLSVKFQIPTEITIDDQKQIRRISLFIQGRPQSLEDISVTFANTGEIQEQFLKPNKGVFRFSGSLCEVALFSKILKIPFLIEGFDMKIFNKTEIQAAIERGDQDLKIKWKSESRQLYRKFVPSLSKEISIKTSQMEDAS